MKIRNKSDLTNALESQDALLKNAWLTVDFCLKNNNKVLNNILKEMFFWKKPITAEQPSPMSKNMVGMRFTGRNYCMKLMSDFLEHNKQFNEFYKPNYETPFVNMLLQKKIGKTGEFENSDFNLLQVITRFAETCKIGGCITYNFNTQTLENYVTFLALRKSGSFYSAEIVIDTQNSVYKRAIRDPGSFDFFVKTPDEKHPQKFLVDLPITNETYLHEEGEHPAAIYFVLC